MSDTGTLHEDARVLALRLAIGWTRCEGETDPETRERYEMHWDSLLQEYVRQYNSQKAREVSTAEQGENKWPKAEDHQFLPADPRHRRVEEHPHGS